jgi:predicted RNA-binding protein with PIN domain
VFDAGARQRGEPTVEVIDGVTVRFGTRASTADHIIERLAYQASRRGEAVDLVVATNDRLQRDVVSAMGVATMRSKALDEELNRAAAVTQQHAQRLRDQSRATERLAHRLHPDVARRLEALRRGDATSDDAEDA